MEATMAFVTVDEENGTYGSSRVARAAFLAPSSPTC
jgi:hypothetical protein